MMKRRPRRIVLGAINLTCLTSAAGAATVGGNVAPWAISQGRTGTVSDAKSVPIVVHMAMKNADALTALMSAVSTPGSARYGRYLSKTEFAARFAPAATDVAAVRSMLSGAGMTDITVGPMGAYVSATATVRQLRRTFGVSQNLYSHAGKTLRANAEAPTIPAALSGRILDIEGLDESGLLRRPMHVSASALPSALPAAATTGIIPPPVTSNNPSPYCSTYFGDKRATLSTAPAPYAQTMPWLVCGYTPQQARAAYGLDKVPLDGHGVTVAIVDAYASPTLKADGNAYAANHRLPALTAKNFKQIIPLGIYDVSAGEACGPQGWFTEQSLDVAAVHGAAPGADIVYIGARDCNASLDVATENAVYNKLADIITNSWSYNGEDASSAQIADDDQAFMAAAAMGISVLFSSGDDGDLSQVNGVATGAYPATSPYVTAVGGTSLGLEKADGTKFEYGWGTYRDFLDGATVNSATSITTSGLATETVYGNTYSAFAFYSGSGGGVSLIEPQPAYQAGTVPAYLSGQVFYANGYSVPLSPPHRVAPDISAFADPYTGYLYGETFTIANSLADTGCVKKTATTEYCEFDEGGTSLASPFTAGMLAIIDQKRGLTGRPAVGFANPFLYSLTTGSNAGAGAGINQVLAPSAPTAVLRGYATNLNEARVVTIDSVPSLVITSPFPLNVCDATICEGIDDVFNGNGRGYSNTTGLGVPYLPSLIDD